jgi:diketogulonate reductase-like aldo/keto reductase
LLAKAIKGFDRLKLTITTKVSPMNLHYKDLIKSLKQSLKKIKTDYIDIYFIHAPNPYISIAELMEATDYLIERKLIKYISLSNFNVSQFKKAQNYTKNKIICNHVHFNLKYRLLQQDGSIKYAQKNDIVIVACRSVQKGLFSAEKIELLDNICLKYNKTPKQIVINWIISQKNLAIITR